MDRDRFVESKRDKLISVPADKAKSLDTKMTGMLKEDKSKVDVIPTANAEC